jgi:hypothetical protein
MKFQHITQMQTWLCFALIKSSEHVIRTSSSRPISPILSYDDNRTPPPNSTVQSDAI